MAQQSGQLEGYLVLRPSGKFGRLKTKKRLWYVYHEQNQQLLYYPNKSDLGKNPPSGLIPLKNVAISLLLEETNSFVLHTDGKEYTFSADSHNSMLDWICTLQHKRDDGTNRFLGQESVRELREKYLSDYNSRNVSFLRSKIATAMGNMTTKEDEVLAKPKKPLTRTQSLTVSQSPKYIMPERLSQRKTISTPEELTRNTVEDVEESPADPHDSNNNEKESQIVKSPISSVESEDSENLDEIFTSGATSPVTSSEDNNEKFVVLKHLNFAKKQREQIANLESRKDTPELPKAFRSYNRETYSVKRIKQLETELMEVKCQLAKAVNRSTIYKNKVLSQEKELQFLRDEISELECGNKSEVVSTGKYSSDVLESHNRFLNEEVIKLSRQIQEQEYKYQTQQFQAKEMEADLEQLKRDYVFLMQSAMRSISQEGPEKMEIYLYGGFQHKARVIYLLNEARAINPNLPVYDISCTCLCHVDSMGFQHCYTEEQLILHYICRQLYHHYNTRVRSYQLHQLKWKEYLKRHGIVLKPTKELKELVRGGIPNPLRSRVWCYLYRYRVKNLMDKSGQHYYNNLCSLAPDSKVVAQNKRQISLDLLRTLPNNIRFSHPNGDGVRKMQEVLQSFCIHNAELGYCQGMNFLVAICLLFMDAENSFWCLVAIVEHYFPSGYYDCNLIGAQVDQEVLKDLMKEKVPAVFQHLQSFDIEICTITLNWFLAIFFDSAPIETVLRIWDCFLLEGPKVIFRFALAIIKMQETAILSKKDAVSVMRQLKTAAKLCFDVDDLVKVAFVDLEPFPCRKDIAAKQSYYLKRITERILRQERERDIRRTQNVTFEKETEDTKNLYIECATLYDTNKILICYGTLSETKVAKVNCEENIMYDLNLKFDNRIKCIHVPNDNLVIFGSISCQVHAYSTKTRKYVWEVALNDSVLSMSSDEENGLIQVYAGLADGTVAVIQNHKDVSKPDTFYVSVGSSPVTCLCLINGKLWCASGNRIIVANLKTFDTEDNFQTSTNGMDYISLVVLGTSGVWITLRGSSVLQLWDHQDMSCRLLYDVSGNQATKSSQTDLDGGDSTFAVSSLLQVNGCIIVGTDEGSILFYDVLSILSRSCSTVYSPSTGRSVEVNSVVREDSQNQVESPSVQNDNPFFRERNDSGCYSSTTTTLTSSRRESSNGFASDKADFEVCYTTLEEPNDYKSGSNTPKESKIHKEENVQTILQDKCELEYHNTRTSSDASTVVDSDTNFETVANSSLKELDASSLAEAVNQDFTSINNERFCFENISTGRRYELSETSDSDPAYTSYGRQLHGWGFNRNLYTITALGSITLDESSNKQSRSSSTQPGRWSKIVAEIHEMKRQLKRKYRDRSFSMPDLNQILCRKQSLLKWKSVSAEAIFHYASAETLYSITTWDSYEYDDLFVAYTDDEFGKPLTNAPRRTSTMDQRPSTNILLESLRLLDRESSLSFTTEEPEVQEIDDEPSVEETQYAPSVLINIGDAEAQSIDNEMTGLRHNRSWTSCDDGSKICSSTNGESHDESTSAADSPIVNRILGIDSQHDFLHLKDWGSGFLNGQKGAASDTASVMSSTSTEQPYSLDLNLVEKIKISDKPIKCLLKTKCNEELTVISCSGCYDDDEAILKWTREGQEKLWTNDPVVEVCPYTNKIRPSRFTRSRLPRRASINLCTESEVSSASTTRSVKEKAKRVKSEPQMITRSTRTSSASQIIHNLFSKSKDDKK